jgi:hypothetical protein
LIGSDVSKAFAEGFDLVLITYDVRVEHGLSAISGYLSPMYPNPSYTLTIQGRMPIVPADYMRYFDMQEQGHHLYQVEVTYGRDPYTSMDVWPPSYDHVAMVKLIYVTTDMEKFVVDVKGAASRRFDQNFYAQVDEVLDDSHKR